MKYLRNRKKQSGMTLMGMVLAFAMGGFFAYLAMLLFPVVISNYTMGNVLTTLNAESGIATMPKSKIKELINKRLRINDIRDVKMDDFKFKQKNQVLTITLDYNNKINFAKNVFILIENHKQVELPRS
ncbi:MAG: DUF4845 domain-containing protein [Gammaproteobacteria bacterium]|nr:DUF4845 domain-containing protein [Gammaproteobacteria bacterium]